MAAAVMPDRHPGWLFADPAHWADMSDWHVRVAELRRDHPVLEVNLPGFERFWALTRHADVLAVSRANDQWQNTPKSVLSARLAGDDGIRVDARLARPPRREEAP